jgi:hypothetical protein
MLVKVVFEALYTVVFNYAQSRKPSFPDHSKNFAFLGPVHMAGKSYSG